MAPRRSGVAPRKPPPKSAQQLATERKMREQAARNRNTQRNNQANARKAEDQKVRDYYKKNGHLATIFANESRNRFDEADSKDVGDLGRQVALGKISRAEAERRIRRGAAVNDRNRLRVGLDVSAELDPKLNALERRRKASKEAYERRKAEAKRAYDTRTQDETRRSAEARAQIAGFYDVLNRQLMASGAGIGEQYAQATQQAQQNNAAVQQQLQQTFQTTNSAIDEVAAGMGGGQTQAQQQMAQDTNILAAQTAQQGQGFVNELQTAGLGQRSINAADTNLGAYEGARNQTEQVEGLQRLLSQLQGDYNEDTTELTGEWTEEDTELAGQYSDLSESRYNRLYEGRKALEDAQAQAAQEAEDRAFERSMAQANLGVKVGNLDVARQRAANDYQLGSGRLNLSAQELAHKQRVDAARLQLDTLKEQRAQANTAAEARLIDAKIKKAEADIRRQEAETAYTQGGKGGGRNGKTPTKGLTAARNVIASEPGFPEPVRKGLTQLITTTLQDPKFRGQFGMSPDSTLNAQSLADTLIENARKRGMGQYEMDLLTDAAYAYFGLL